MDERYQTGRGSQTNRGDWPGKCDHRGSDLETASAIFLPDFIWNFFQQLYNTADAVVVGRFVGKEALAAVGGSTSMLTNLLVGFFVGLSSGATVIIAQFYGAGRGQRVSEAVHTAIAFSLLCGILMTVGGLLFSDTALRLMGTPEDIMDNASGYLHIYFVGITANLLYNMGAGILRAIGDSKRPFYFLVISCFTNIALDLLFVVGLRMGVRGAAVATILSQVVSACLVLGTLMRADGSYRFEIRKTRITPGDSGADHPDWVSGGTPVGYVFLFQPRDPEQRQCTGNRHGGGVGCIWKDRQHLLDDH